MIRRHSGEHHRQTDREGQGLNQALPLSSWAATFPTTSTCCAFYFFCGLPSLALRLTTVSACNH